MSWGGVGRNETSRREDGACRDLAEGKPWMRLQGKEDTASDRLVLLEISVNVRTVAAIAPCKVNERSRGGESIGRWRVSARTYMGVVLRRRMPPEVGVMREVSGARERKGRGWYLG